MPNDLRRLRVEILEHPDPRNVAIEVALAMRDPAHGNACPNGCAHALDDKIIEPPIINRNFLELVAEHGDPNLLDRKAVGEKREDTDTRAGGSRRRNHRFRPDRLLGGRLRLIRCGELHRLGLRRMNEVQDKQQRHKTYHQNSKGSGRAASSIETPGRLRIDSVECIYKTIHPLSVDR